MTWEMRNSKYSYIYHNLHILCIYCCNILYHIYFYYFLSFILFLLTSGHSVCSVNTSTICYLFFIIRASVDLSIYIVNTLIICDLVLSIQEFDIDVVLCYIVMTEIWIMYIFMCSDLLFRSILYVLIYMIHIFICFFIYSPSPLLKFMIEDIDLKYEKINHLLLNLFTVIFVFVRIYGWYR